MRRTIPTLLGALVCAVVYGAGGAAAQDLDAGKSPSQLFAKSCVACHRAPGGLGAGRDPRAVAAFLTQHYTSSRATAATLAGYLAGVGGDPRAARARTRTEPPTEPQAAGPQAPERQPQTPGVQGAGPAAARAADPEEARAAARERQKRRERREALEAARALAAEQKPAQPRRLGLPSVSSDPPPSIVSPVPVPVPQRRAAADRSAGDSAADGQAAAGSVAATPASLAPQHPDSLGSDPTGSVRTPDRHSAREAQPNALPQPETTPAPPAATNAPAPVNAARPADTPLPATGPADPTARTGSF